MVGNFGLLTPREGIWYETEMNAMRPCRTW